MGAAVDARSLDLVQAILDPHGESGIELFGKGQVFFKEPLGGTPKLLHQDNAYFEFAKKGPVGTLNYAVDTSEELQNGPLYVVPGTHKRGGYGKERTGAYTGLHDHNSFIAHVDTRSHLALNPTEWTFDDAIEIPGKAGDTLFFHINCIHGSTPNFSNTSRPTFINRYLAADDYQILHATSVAQRSAQEDIFKNREKTQKVNKERGLLVRGQRIYDKNFTYDLAIAHH